ncbi:hypothetical protein MtrunA17_Chr7g0269251 [Medicago truncatula]|uniref:Uncharacterized protein n=1 Tax=Medicago truncatula TaxID=3880 RepID=A0A396HDG4_MEDTR|nr:hypothetical protein MtrunA17_Chr7g0269251 [Medicago truncatula]
MCHKSESIRRKLYMHLYYNVHTNIPFPLISYKRTIYIYIKINTKC